MNRFLTTLACAALLIATIACHRAAVVTIGNATTEEKNVESASERIVLTTQEVEKIGLRTAPARVVLYVPEAQGFAVVVAHETIAAAVAELRTAGAMDRQSQTALARSRGLAGTAGALPLDTQEQAVRQSTVDRAALELAQRRLTATFGHDAPWGHAGKGVLLAPLANGDTQLVRVTFPLGSVGTRPPDSLELTRVDTPTVRLRTATTIWNAPADPAVPGRSFFTVLRSGDFGEGERLLAWAPQGAAETGVEIPSAAAVISDGRYWCYVEDAPGRFVRTELDANVRTEHGYFIKQGLASGAKIVVKSAGLLLARELNPGTTTE